MNPNTPESKIVKVARDGAEIGEHKLEFIPNLLEAGILRKTDHYWMQGMAGWLPLDQLHAPAIGKPAKQTNSSGKSWWLLGGFLMPYVFAWRIIFDKTYGFTKTVKIAYSVWMACFLMPFLMPTSSSHRTGASRTDDLEAKNAAFLARLTPEQREAMKTLQRNMRLALEENFASQDADKDGRLNMKEFLSQGVLKNDSTEADFYRKDTNKDGYVTFEESIK